VPRKSHRPTAEKKKLVRTLAAVGIKHEEIAQKIDIALSTLTRYYADELANGRTDANSQIAKSLFEKARGGDTTAMIFWLKCRAGWREAHRSDPPEKPTEKPRDIRDDLSEAALRILNRIGGDGELDPPAS
jgi:hypothetical protein